MTFEGSDFATVFSSIGNLQIGVFVPAALAGVDQSFTFDVDGVTVVPSPPVAALLALSGLLLGKHRRRPPYARAVMPGDGLSLEAGTARALDDMGSANSWTFVSVSE